MVLREQCINGNVFLGLTYEHLVSHPFNLPAGIAFSLSGIAKKVKSKIMFYLMQSVYFFF
jgi:hypothetical protein